MAFNSKSKDHDAKLNNYKANELNELFLKLKKDHQEFKEMTKGLDSMPNKQYLKIKLEM